MAIHSSARSRMRPVSRYRSPMMATESAPASITLRALARVMPPMAASGRSVRPRRRPSFLDANYGIGIGLRGCGEDGTDGQVVGGLGGGRAKLEGVVRRVPDHAIRPGHAAGGGWRKILLAQMHSGVEQGGDIGAVVDHQHCAGLAAEIRNPPRVLKRPARKESFVAELKQARSRVENLFGYIGRREREALDRIDVENRIETGKLHRSTIVTLLTSPKNGDQMRSRLAASPLACLGALAVMLAAPAFSQNKPAAAKAKASAIPRTPDGHPDFEGVWTNATVTPMERPAMFKDKPTLTDAEAKVYEKRDLDELNKQDGASDGPLIAAAGSSGTGGYNVLFVDRGTELARVDGVKRTSLIIDPPDGRVPPMTAEARQRNVAMTQLQPLRQREGAADQRALPYRVRLDLRAADDAGALQQQLSDRADAEFPDDSGGDGARRPRHPDRRNARSVERAEVDGRFDRTLGGRYAGGGHHQFQSRGGFRGSSKDLHVIERFQRVDAKTILYRATIDDPTTFTKPLTMEYPFDATPGPVYEYACHEGNYAMPDILGGARKKDAETSRK